MRTLDEAIRGEEAVADACKEQANMCDLNDPYAKKVAYENGKCAEEHRQIAEWLKELKKLKKLACCEDCVSRVDLINKFEIIDKSYGSDFYWEVRKIVDSLPSVKPVACIGTVKFSKEDMQELVDDAVKELVLENAR
jgi:hypothetical protein